VRRIPYFYTVLWVAAAYYGISIFIYIEVANFDPVATTIWNLVAILVVLIIDKLTSTVLENWYQRLKESGRRPGLTKALLFWIDDVGPKPALYLFYIVILIVSAIFAADPTNPLYTEFWQGYLLAARYGLLVLVAADKFLKQMFKEIDRARKRLDISEDPNYVPLENEPKQPFFDYRSDY
jgi:hypothetical protein